MELEYTPEIATVERVAGGIVAKFTSGRSVFISAALLHEVADRAAPLDETSPDW